MLTCYDILQKKLEVIIYKCTSERYNMKKTDSCTHNFHKKTTYHNIIV